MVLFFCKLTRGFVRRHNRASPRSAAAPEVTLTAPPPEVRHSCCRDAAPEEKMLPMESSNCNLGSSADAKTPVRKTVAKSLKSRISKVLKQN